VEPGEDRRRGRDHLETRYRLRHQQIGLRDPRRHPQGAAGRRLRAAHPYPRRHHRVGDEVRAAAVVADRDPVCGPSGGYHDYEGPAVELDEREPIVSDLGPHDARIMRNHGLLTCGATIQQPFNTMYQLELSCRSQVDAMAARAELVMPGENVL